MSRFTDISDLTAAIPVEIIDITDCDGGRDPWIMGATDDEESVALWLANNGVEVVGFVECCGDLTKFYVKL